MFGVFTLYVMPAWEGVFNFWTGRVGLVVFLYILYQCVLYLCVEVTSCFVSPLPEYLDFHEGDGQGKNVGVHRSQTVHHCGC